MISPVVVLSQASLTFSLVHVKIQVMFDTIAELTDWLDTHGVNYAAWGRGTAKTVADLWAEYTAGETAFSDAPVSRRVVVVQLSIRNGAAELLELAQELSDGRRRERRRPPSEKLKQEETPLTAALRCLHEELGLAPTDVVIYGDIKTTETTLDSPSYPGLPTRYIVHTLTMTTDQLPAAGFWRDNLAEGDVVRRHLWGWWTPQS